MNKYIILGALLLPFTAFSQTGFKIAGKMGVQNNSVTVYLDHTEPGGKKTLDSTTVVNGAFSFTGRVTEPQAAIIAARYQGDKTKKIRDYVAMYLENADFTVTSPDSLRKAVIRGSKINDENQMLRARTKLITAQSGRISREMTNAENKKPEAKSEAWFKSKADTLNQVKLAVKELKVNFVKTHPEDYYSLFILDTYVSGMGESADSGAQQLFDGLSPALKMTRLGKEINQDIRRIKAREVGSTVVDFTQTDVQGKPFTLSSLRGKYVLIDFWASWCVPCREENPNVRKAYSKLKEKGFEIVGISLDNKKDAWEKAIQTDDLPWIQISDLKGWKNDVAVQFAITSVPNNFLLDPNGVIIATNLRGENLDEQLAAFIK